MLQNPASTVLNYSMLGPHLHFEEEAQAKGFSFIAGLDEVGRGALAGPVVAAAVILNPVRKLPVGLNDSKKVSRQERERITLELKSNVLAFAVGEVPAPEIDRINILQATLVAMQQAVDNLSPDASFLLIDALKLPSTTLPQRAIIRGDAVCASIAAASIIAKTYRDALMRDFDEVYPAYGFSSHVGYGTRRHLTAIQEHGPCPIHRRTFRGVLPVNSVQ
ncbi:MAG: ribonuclease HII [Pyrinomonadaceae bacterium]